MNQGIAGGCGCDGYSGGVSSTQSVSVNSTSFALVSPTAAQFYAGNPMFGYYLQNANATISINLKLGAGHFFDSQEVDLQSGTAPYTVTLPLDYINAMVGSIMEIQLVFPNSTNPSVIITDRASGNQLVPTITGPGFAYTTLLKFVWNGSIWKFRSQI